MIVQCQSCLKYFDDEFRNTTCPHEAFLANDGQNNFKIYDQAYLSDQPLGEGSDYQNWLNENEIKKEANGSK